MNSPLIQCPKCRGQLLDGVFNLEQLVPCPLCRAPLQIEVFPAFFRPVTSGRDGETVMVEGESTCFYHPQKKAVLPCAGCGRFMCALCDCELHGQHFCPMCLEAGRTKGKIKSLENKRTLYDSIALALAIAPLVVFYFTFITAPAALFIAIRYWNSPMGIVRRSKIRYVLAMILASLQIIGWALVLYNIFNHKNG
jgi:hypothetical protein